MIDDKVAVELRLIICWLVLVSRNWPVQLLSSHHAARGGHNTSREGTSKFI